MLLSCRMAGLECADVAEPVGNSGRVAVLRLSPRETHSRLAFRQGRQGRGPSHYRHWLTVASTKYVVATAAHFKFGYLDLLGSASFASARPHGGFVRLETTGSLRLRNVTYGAVRLVPAGMALLARGP